MKIFSFGLLSVLLMSSTTTLLAAGPFQQHCGSCSPVQTQSCQSTCSTCDTQAGACCYAESIDIDSLTDKAVSERLYESLQAKLIFEGPEDADLTLAGQKMTTAGAERTFLVAVNNQKSTYRYDIQVDVVRGGKIYYKKKQIEILKAGAILKITVASPKVEDGEIPEIALEVLPIMLGGAPEAAKKTDADAHKDAASTESARVAAEEDTPAAE
jgi:uncharacterized protein (TIGR03000 family)